MLEIFGLTFLCYINRKNAVAVGKSGGGAIGLTLVLWIGLEFVGAFIGGIAQLGFGIYILALIFAAIGGAASYVITKKPSKNQGMQYTPDNQHNPLQANIPQPQGGGGPDLQAGVLKQNKFCVRCGQPLEAGTAFCGGCGAPVGAMTQPNVAAPIAPPVSPPTVEAETPIVPEPESQPIPIPCTHEYKHFTCMKCGEKAPKSQLVSQGTRKQNQYTYEDYAAETAEEAKYFLEQTSIAKPNYYVMVHTPEGEWAGTKTVFSSHGFAISNTIYHCGNATR